MIVTFILLNAMDVILNLRGEQPMSSTLVLVPHIPSQPVVYAFYRRSRKIGTLLGVVFILRFALATSFAAIYLPYLAFDELCGLRMPDPVVFAFL